MTHLSPKYLRLAGILALVLLASLQRHPNAAAAQQAQARALDTSDHSGDGRAALLVAHEPVSARRQDAGGVDLTMLPLGDGRIASTPTEGMLYLCNLPRQATMPGEASLPWVHGNTFDITAKAVVSGSVSWPDAAFAALTQDDRRLLTGNDLPVNHTTGVFPVSRTDPAFAYRPAPGSIKAATYSFDLPANPVAAAAASCVGGEVGIAVSGVAIFSAVDAQLRDAVGQEVQDACSGHPNDFGYHYHSISNCLPDTADGHSALMGYAFDGFGIYGHRGENGETLTDADLDECHGHTHVVDWNGSQVEMYHYHATWEFPYTVGCFRGTPVVRGPAFGPPPGR